MRSVHWISCLTVSGLLLVACDGGLFNPARPVGDLDPDGRSGDGEGGDLIDRKPEDCPEEYDYFVSRIWEPVLSVKCIGCHNAEGPAKKSDLVLQTPEEEGFLAHNFRVVSTVAAKKLGSKSALLLRPSGNHPDGHTGGKLVADDSISYAELEGFVSQLDEPKCEVKDPLAACGDDAPPGPRQLRRLTRTEYDATVSDLLGLPSDAAERFTPENVVHGFDNNAAALTVTPLLADQLFTAAEALAQTAVAEKLSALAPCSATGDRACAQNFIESFGLRAFRRPLSATEVDRYLTLYDLAATEGFAAGAQTVIATMLQSPHFLYRTELGAQDKAGDFVLSQYEIASELSYLLWGSMPDAALFDAAKAKKLGTHAQIVSEVERLLASPRAKQTISRFMSQWLDVTTLQVVSKDAAIFPELTADVRTSMAKELDAFANFIVLDQAGTLSDLLTSRQGFVDESLSALRGIEVPADAEEFEGMSRVTLPKGQAAGVLTLGAVLTTHARTNESSPIRRGRLVRQRMLCQELPDPPPGVNATPPPLDPNLSVRDRFAAHASKQPCLGCHRLIDPIGFGFEHFDGIGRYRAKENGHAIDDHGEIVSSPATNGEFEGIEGLSSMLADSDDVSDCFVTQWFRFAYGVEENKELSCQLGALKKAFRGGRASVVDLIASLVDAPRFTKRREQAAETPSGGGDTPSEPGGDSGSSDNGGTMTPTPTPTSDVTVTQLTENSWDTGYCNKVTVANDTDAAITWTIVIEVTGTISQMWDASYTKSGSKVVVNGLDYNASLAPGASLVFGYCADK